MARHAWDEDLSRRHDRRHYAAERQHEPVISLGWELLDACPGLEPGAAERSGDLPDSRPYPLTRATSLDATVSQTPDRHQHGAYDVYSGDRDQKDPGKPAFVQINDVSRL